MTDLLTKVVAPADGAKPVWKRSATRLGAVLGALALVAPSTPWWGFLILACAQLVLEQLVAPSAPASAVSDQNAEVLEQLQRQADRIEGLDRASGDGTAYRED